MKHLLWLVAAVVFVGASFQTWAAPENPARLPTEADTPPKVELLEPGKEPRTALRLSFQKGVAFERVMSMRMGVHMVVNGQEGPKAPAPTISMTLRGEIESVDAEAHARYFSEVSEVAIEGDELPPAMQTLVKAQLADMMGTRVSARISPRGIQSEGKVQTKSTNPQLLATLDSVKQSFAQMSVPFPVEAVGVDGRWAVTSEMKMNGLPLRQRMVYRVVSVSERELVLSATLEQSLATPDAKMENLPAGFEGVAKSLSSEMSGRSIIALDQVMPRSSSISGISKAEMEMTSMGQKTPVSATYDIAMRLRTPKDEAPGKAPDEKTAEGGNK